MKFKLIVAIIEDKLTDLTIETARVNGATGCTVITSARGEGLKPVRTFLGLTVTGQRDIVLMLVEEHGSRRILEAIGAATRDAAAFLFRSDLGSLEPGRRADLIVVPGDPSSDVSALREVERVMVGGRWVDVAQLRSR